MERNDGDLSLDEVNVRIGHIFTCCGYESFMEMKRTYKELVTTQVFVDECITCREKR